jgi:hypothetical protein
MPIGQAKFGLLGGVADLGKLILIQTQTASGNSYLDFTSIDEDLYNVHFILYNNIEFITTETSLKLQFYESGVLETGSVYTQAFLNLNSNAAFNYTTNKSNDSLFSTQADGDNTNGYAWLYNLGDNTKYSFHNIHSTGIDDSVGKSRYGGGVLPQASLVDGIRVTRGDANTFNGTVSLYGLKETL